VIGEEQYRGVEVYLDANGRMENISHTPPGDRPPPKFIAAWRVTIQYRERNRRSSDTTYVVWVDSIRRAKRSDGRQSCYVRHVIRKDHEDYALSNFRRGFSVMDHSRTPMRGAILEIAQRAVQDLTVNLPCCVRHLLIGHYDGSECVGLAPTALGPGSSSASEYAPVDSAS
jgi:hypothetical protein